MTARTGETPTPSIDKDIMEKANECVAQFRWNNDNRWHMFVAEALQAVRNEERERCAKIADDALMPVHIGANAVAGAISTARQIATTIRKGGE